MAGEYRRGRAWAACMLLALLTAGLGLAKVPAPAPVAKPAKAAKPAAPRLTADLKGVAGVEFFKKEMTPITRQMLAKQEFAVQPAAWEQPFEAYPDVHIKSPRFVTIDGALHLWHLFYDYSLRFIETEKLFPELESMVKGLLAEARMARQVAPEGIAREAATHVLAYAAVAAKGMGIDTPALPAEARRLADADWAKIVAHEGMSRSEVTGFDTAFDMMVPRDTTRARRR